MNISLYWGKVDKKITNINLPIIFRLFLAFISSLYKKLVYLYLPPTTRLLKTYVKPLFYFIIVSHVKKKTWRIAGMMLTLVIRFLC